MRPQFFLATALCIVLQIAHPQSASATSALAAGGLSTVLPGAGQIYTKQPQKGLVLFGIYGGALTMAYVSRPDTWEDPSTGEFAEFNTGTPASTKAIFYGSVVVAGGTLLYAVFDAVGAAKRLNRQPISLLPDFRHGGAGVRLAVTF